MNRVKQMKKRDFLLMGAWFVPFMTVGIILREYFIFYIAGLFVLYMIFSNIRRKIYHNFYDGLKLYRQGRYEEASNLFIDFEQDLLNRPWMQSLMFFARGNLTTSYGAIATNAVAGCFYLTGNITRAKEYYWKAISYDSMMPPSYYMLSCIAIDEKEIDKAQEYFEKSASLGFARVDFETFLEKYTSSKNAVQNSDKYCQIIKDCVELIIKPNNEIKEFLDSISVGHDQYFNYIEETLNINVDELYKMKKISVDQVILLRSIKFKMDEVRRAEVVGFDAMVATSSWQEVIDEAKEKVSSFNIEETQEVKEVIEIKEEDKPE